jgi:hypothetical protein
MIIQWVGMIFQCVGITVVSFEEFAEDDHVVGD